MPGSRKTRSHPWPPVARHHDRRPGRGALPVFGGARTTKQHSFVDSDEFAASVALIYPRIYWVARQWCTKAEDPDDFVQDTFLKVWKTWSKSRDNEVWTAPYCVKALKSVIIDARRKHTVPIADGVDVDLTEVSYEVELRNGAMDSRTQSLLGHLTERQRSVVTAVVFDGYKPAEVAEMYGLGRQTVYDAKRVALAKLADLI